MSHARDGYREYFTEKLWEWLPAIYREMDGLEGPGLGNHALRGLIEALASQAAVLKRDQDRLWDDAYVELADDWAIPYLADLLATRLVSVQNPRARRIDVAKTVYYRRRKGTLLVLEQLIDDMSGWDGKVVEQFKRLARTPHGLDGALLPGRLSGTPQGGLADLRNVRSALFPGGNQAFDEFSYTPDMRKPQGLQAGLLGQRGIVKLNFHLYRMQVVELIGVQPRRMLDVAGSRDGYSFDPSGRDIALFCVNEAKSFGTSNNLNNGGGGNWASAEEWRLPRAMDCRLLAEAAYMINDAAIAAVLTTATIATQLEREQAAEDLRRLAGMRFAGDQGGSPALLRLIKGMPHAAQLMNALPEILHAALDSQCASVQLYPNALELGFKDGSSVGYQQVRAGQLPGYAVPAGTNLNQISAVIDPVHGRLLWDIGAQSAANARVRYHVGVLGALGAGGLQRQVSSSVGALHWQNSDSSAGTPNNGVLEIIDSSSFDNPPDALAVQDCSVLAADSQRPYLRLQNDWQFTASGDDRVLLLDGLWVGAAQGLPSPANIVLDGNFERVTLRYCTLDPGGVDGLGATLPPVALVIKGFVEQLVLERCIIASVRTEGAKGLVQNLQVSDSVIHAASSGTVALDLQSSHITLRRSSIIAMDLHTQALQCEWLDACDSIIAGQALVSNAQQGCFRFSARGPQSLVPHPYQSHKIDPSRHNLGRVFASLRFGDAAYASLSPVAPTELARGAEQGLEMGAFNDRALSIKLDSLRIKTDEFMPFGRLPNFITEN